MSLIPHPSAEGMSVTIRKELGGAWVCAVSGELDIATKTPVLHELRAAVRARPALLVIDLARVTFCDSSGLNALLLIRREAAEAAVDLRLAACSDRVLRLLNITGADDIFALHPDVASALP